MQELKSFNIYQQDDTYVISRKGAHAISNLSIVDIQEIYELCRATLNFNPEPVSRTTSIVCDVYGVTKKQMHSVTRKREIVLARQTFYFIIKKLMPVTCVLGASIFGQDHATFLHGVKQIQQTLDLGIKTVYYKQAVQCIELSGLSLNECLSEPIKNKRNVNKNKI